VTVSELEGSAEQKKMLRITVLMGAKHQLGKVDIIVKMKSIFIVPYDFNAPYHFLVTSLDFNCIAYFVKKCLRHKIVFTSVCDVTDVEERQVVVAVAVVAVVAVARRCSRKVWKSRIRSLDHNRCVLVKR
jgi:hypothetical protein